MVTITRLIVAVVILVVGVLSGDAGAQGRGRGRGQGQGGSSTGVTVVVVFRDTDRASFHDYFIAHKILPQRLPPGIAKNIARGKPLPPGIAKRALPRDLIAIGPKVDKDVSFAIVGEFVVAIRRGVVIDILTGVFK